MYPIQFFLCVDNFWIKYANKEDVNHLIEILKKYKIPIDCKGKNYCGLIFD